YTAKYNAESKSTPASIDVTFRGQRPTSAAAETAVRKCIIEAERVMFIRSEMLAQAWYSTSGRENDDDLVTLADGSRHLSYDPKTKKIRTWNEREGVKPLVSPVTS